MNIKGKKINQNKNQNKNNNDKNSNETDGNNVKKDVEVELYSNLEGDTELADALWLDEQELGDIVDRIVVQLVASYLGIIYIYLNYNVLLMCYIYIFR